MDPVNPMTVAADVATQINAEHAAAVKAANAAVGRALNAGRLLLGVKESLPHGHFLPWVRANLKLSVRTAQAYMRLASHSPQLVDAGPVTIQQALDLIAEPKALPHDEPAAGAGPGRLLVRYVEAGVLSAEHLACLDRLPSVYTPTLLADFTHLRDGDAAAGVRRGSRCGSNLSEAWALLRAIRPEDMPVCWFGGLLQQSLPEPEREGWHLELVATACDDHDGAMVAGGYVMPQWESAAFWWASVAVYLQLSPQQLRAGIQAWEGRFLSAVLGVLSGSATPPGHGSPQAEHDEWWGYRADLRHSNATAFGTDPPPSVRELAAAFAGSVDCDLLLPSQMQPWSLHRRVTPSAA